jgi:hypothetical protein
MMIRKYGIFALIGIVLTVAIAVVLSPPFHVTFVLAYQIKRILALFLGIAYPIFFALYTLTPLSLILIFILITLFFVGIWRVWRARRYPLLIPITALIGANILFIGTSQFLDTGRLTEPLTICEDYFLSQLTFQVVRYPIEARLRDDAQTFILMSDDNRQTWRQIFTAYAINPQIFGCDNIESSLNDATTWSIIIEERKGNTLDNDIIRYTTTDGGSTFERQNP